MRLLTFLLSLGVFASFGAGQAAAQNAVHHTAAERIAQLEHRHHAMASREAHAAAMRMQSMDQISLRMSRHVERLGSLRRPYYARRGEVLAIGLDDDALQELENSGWTRKGQRELTALAMTIDTLRVPRRMSLRRGLKKLSASYAHAVIAPNALFHRRGSAPQKPAEILRSRSGASSATLGLIDTAADRAALGPLAPMIIAKSFASDGDEAKDQGNGTAVRGDDQRAEPGRFSHGTMVAGIAAEAGADQLYIADVFGGERRRADAADLAQAVDWMVSEGVRVVNISLAGPKNAVVEAALKRAAQQNTLFVASVGNDGPHRRPRYPAAYDEVIAVTAVDEQLELYRRANTGPAVDVAAFGVGLDHGDERQPVSGTSFAAPVVSAFLAAAAGTSGLDAASARALLAQSVLDRGAPGRDPLYGEGVLIRTPEPTSLAALEDGRQEKERSAE
ncbi:MAG: S8 family serine peptidase [Pseudomonadota bacterium]